MQKALPHFGNARAAHNMINTAKRQMASRLNPDEEKRFVLSDFVGKEDEIKPDPMKLLDEGNGVTIGDFEQQLQEIGTLVRVLRVHCGKRADPQPGTGAKEIQPFGSPSRPLKCFWKQGRFG